MRLLCREPMTACNEGANTKPDAVNGGTARAACKLAVTEKETPSDYGCVQRRGGAPGSGLREGAAPDSSLERPGSRERRVRRRCIREGHRQTAYAAQRGSSAAAEERSDQGTGKRRLPAVGCNEGLGITLERAKGATESWCYQSRGGKR
jgi:hypothetical protein